MLIQHERSVILVFRHQRWYVGDAPFRLKFVVKVTHPLQKMPKIFAYNVPVIRDSEKSSIMMNRKHASCLSAIDELLVFLSKVELFVYN